MRTHRRFGRWRRWVGAGLLLSSGCGRTQLTDLTAPAGTIALVASTDDAAAIHLRWTVPAGIRPTGYLLRRDGAALAYLPAGTHAYDDRGTEPGGLSAPASLTASRGTRSDAVALVWSDARTAGAEHLYQVSALDRGAETIASNLAAAMRAAPAVLGYEFSRDDGATWLDAGIGTRFDDTGAPRGSIAAVADATPRQAGGYVRVRVVAEPTTEPAAPSAYRVRARTPAGATPASPPAQGYRGVGDVISYQWQRSAGEVDAGYADLPDVTGSIWFDGGAPLGQPRYYRAVMRSDGATGVTAGARAVLLGVRSITASGYHACALLTDGKVVCWGDNYSGQAPPGPSTDSFKSVSTNFSHTCGVRADDKVVCWGDNSYGEAPPGPSTDSFKSVSAGDLYTCGVRADDKVLCWGYQAWADPSASADSFRSVAAGEFGKVCGLRFDDRVVCWFSGYAQGAQGPYFPSTDSFESISAGPDFVCGVRTDGKVVCWGDNMRGQAPPGPSVDSFKTVGAGLSHACAIRLDDKVVCWGENAAGQAPPGPSVDSFASVAGGFYFTCGVHLDGRLACWGSKGGDWKPGRSNESFKAVSASAGSSCALRADGTPVCWGDVLFEQMPAWLSTDSLISISLGLGFGCAIRPDGHVVCWGSNFYGAAPPGPSSDAFESISTGYAYTCGVRLDHKMLCWGSDTDGIGAQAVLQRPSVDDFRSVSAGPLQICGVRSDQRLVCWGAEPPPAAETFRSVSAGSFHSCGVRADDGKVVCWGNNGYGQAPPEPSADRFKSVSTGGDFTCGVRADHRIVCWGNNNVGQAPPGPTLDRFESVSASATSSATPSFAATNLESSYACAIRSDHKLLCWGGTHGL